MLFLSTFKRSDIELTLTLASLLLRCLLAHLLNLQCLVVELDYVDDPSTETNSSCTFSFDRLGLEVCLAQIFLFD